MTNIEKHQTEILREQTYVGIKTIVYHIRIVLQSNHRAHRSVSERKIVELGSGAWKLEICYSPSNLYPIFFPIHGSTLCAALMQCHLKMVRFRILCSLTCSIILERPNAFFKEARRVLTKGGRVIIFEPYISASSMAVYGLLHHEPVAWNASINYSDYSPSENHYYAAQGNATRLFFQRETEKWLKDWKVFHKQPVVSFSYLLSGGIQQTGNVS